MSVRLILVLSIAAVIRASKVCYDRVGCFEDDDPYSGTIWRPIPHLPMSPETMNVRYLLFTRENLLEYQVINALEPSTVSGTNFKSSRKSAFVVHGYGEKGDKAWVVTMCHNLLAASDVNCFCVDWSNGAKGLYTQAANNVRVAGAEIALFLGFLQSQYNYKMSDVYLIGYSLGAQAVGEAGKRQEGIGRATGVDPAGPYFTGTPPEVRLDPTDADIVDIIHTNGPDDDLHLGLGIGEPCGNIDFYPNGGKQMPGCEKVNLTLKDIDDQIAGLEEKMFCSHQMSVKYLAASFLRWDGLRGYPASSYSEFNQGFGFPCTLESCAFMGYKADEYVIAHRQDSSRDRIFFLNTGQPPNYQCWRYNVAVSVTKSSFLMGNFAVALCGMVGCSHAHDIHTGLIQPGSTYSAFIDVESNEYPIEHMLFVWHKYFFNLGTPEMTVSAITVQHGPSGETSVFCGGVQVEGTTVQVFPKCPS